MTVPSSLLTGEYNSYGFTVHDGWCCKFYYSFNYKTNNYNDLPIIYEKIKPYVRITSIPEEKYLTKYTEQEIEKL